MFEDHTTKSGSRLLAKLRPKTYLQYQRVWARFLAFVYRTRQESDTSPLRSALRFTLTEQQLTLLDEAEQLAQELTDSQDSREIEKLKDYLDHSVTQLSLVLLRFTITGDRFQAALVAFLAVLGLNSRTGAFHEASTFTPMLSAIVKIIQLLTISLSLRKSRAKPGQAPGAFLQRFRKAWLVSSGHTPFAHLLALRSYGRRVRNCTTSQGFIQWSDDLSSLTFKDIEFNLDRFRGFLHIELDLLQDELAQLLLVDRSGEEAALEPPVSGLQDLDLEKLQDNPAKRDVGWSFIQEPDNRLGGLNQQLLGRIFQEEDLQDRFLANARLYRTKNPTASLDQDGHVRPEWALQSVSAFLKLHDQFLARLGLLVMILGGQPPRTPELFSLRVENSIEGPRNIFLENGLVSLVSCYHKGYSIEGSVKLIHRYLPPVLSLIVVRYLILVRPLVQQLNHLALGLESLGTYLWDPSKWSSMRLSNFFATETSRELGPLSRLSVRPWRHLAIAISRTFLPKDNYFDREMGAEQMQTADQQAAHSPYTAASIYGRLWTEAVGHIRPLRERFRRISVLWHDFWLKSASSSTDKESSSTTEPSRSNLPEPLHESVQITPPDLSTSPDLPEDGFEHTISDEITLQSEARVSPPKPRVRVTGSQILPPAPTQQPFPAVSAADSPTSITPSEPSAESPSISKEVSFQAIEPAILDSSLLVVQQQQMLQQFLIQQQQIHSRQQNQMQRLQLEQLMKLIQSPRNNEDDHRDKRARLQPEIHDHDRSP
ncbi:MAG: hypothetical protein LQ350_008675 [Teloschistes chrysophthalmus]|nr:MAG: hypothetical protein LQ350_008675 [Niorma chrysophthalma]